jgi:hypothetical protein
LPEVGHQVLKSGDCDASQPARSEGPRRPLRARLSQQIDLRHPLVRLAGLIDWDRFEARFGQLYHPDIGRPGVPIRLMVGLSYLQHVFALSDEAVVERWVENPYWQYFCGFDYLQLALPIDPSSLVRWRQRIGQDGIELLLQETITAAQRSEAVKPQSLERVSVDTTVQPKAIAHPLDSRLYHRGREILVRLAQCYGVPLRQSYARLGKKTSHTDPRPHPGRGAAPSGPVGDRWPGGVLAARCRQTDTSKNRPRGVSIPRWFL